MVTPRRVIIGLDESGWGAYAGPFTVGCAMYWSDFPGHRRLKDCKRFSSHNALRLGVETVKDTAIWYAAGARFHANTFKEFEEAKDLLMIQLANEAFDHVAVRGSQFLHGGYCGCDVIVDGEDTPPGLTAPDGEVYAIPKADVNMPAVSAASILAKYLRDEYMIRISKKYPPEFKLDSNKGYHSKDHMTALKKYGALDIHHPYIYDVQQAIKEKGYWNGEGTEGH